MSEAETDFADIIPVILSGGSGSRLWPVSRLSYPKQFLPLLSERSLIQETALRIAPALGFAPPIIVCSEEHRFIVAEQMRQIEIDPTAILLEPVGRNTAPALTVAALVAQQAKPDAILLVLPADHYIGDPQGLRDAVKAALVSVKQGYLGTFGMRPTEPSTGYGYVKPGAALPGSAAHIVDSFVEKPDRETAEGFVEQGYLWNSGMFLMPVGLYLEEVERYVPDVGRVARSSVAEAVHDLTFLRLGASFSEAPSISVDYAVMERSEKVAVM
ncbi:MAG: NTP transferase domain-containing protein, partial [Alphaproteobacteria bacterium]|nr:NTP transferase domain-containing protein [Alphaproteobacteria bacterium]